MRAVDTNVIVRYLTGDAGLVSKARDWAEAGMDFADALHLAAAHGYEGFLTFDKRFARLGARTVEMSVETP